MATKLRDSIKPKGHLEITKVYRDGKREVVYSKHNVITVGMGITLSEMFAHATDEDPGSTLGNANIGSYRIKYFQIGTGGDTVADPAPSSLTSLGSPCVLSQYGDQASLIVGSHNLWQDGALSNNAFAKLDDANIRKYGNTGVSFTFDLDVNTANGVAIDEIGIFSADPFLRLYATQQGVRASVLCAYRKFPEITKTTKFALAFKWTIIF
jgi:hypothetical protein